MKLITTTAIAVVAAAAAAPAAAQYSAPAAAAQQTPAPDAAAPAAKPLKLSAKAQKAIIELQKAVNANDAAAVAARGAEAQAVASTPDDRYAIAQLQLKAAIAANDYAGMTRAVDGIAASGYVDAATTGKLYASLGTTFYNAKQYAQASAMFQRAGQADPRNTEALILLGEAQFAQGQKAEAAATFQRGIQARMAAGAKPDESLLKRAVGVAYEAQLPVAVELGRQWATAYPSADSWRNSIAIYRNLMKPDVEGTLMLLRLMQATGALTTPGDYALFATAAADQSNFNEAQAVIDAGIAAKAVDPSSSQFREIVSGLKGKPKANAAQLAEASRTAQSGMALLRIGDRYYAMGDYAKAVELYRQAMGKPGVDAAVANLHIGMALARSGDKAGAIAALNAVTGPRAEIAKFWLTYVNQRA